MRYTSDESNFSRLTVFTIRAEKILEKRMDFTLPALTQESFSRWYNKKVARTDGIDERVVYPGIKLDCTTKSRDLRSVIQPHHVFITHEMETNTFHHKVLGSNNLFVSLPKRLYSHCFRNINIHSIPTDNRIVVRLTENSAVTLPYIPDDFVHQKRAKRTSGTRTRNQREVKRIKGNPVSNTIPYTGWVTQVLSPATELGADDAIDSFTLLNYIRKELENNETKLDVCMPNPFAELRTIEDITNSPDKMTVLTAIIQFVHHYAPNI